MINEPIDLSSFGFVKGYYLYRDGSIWSEAARLRGQAHFKTPDYTGCVMLKTPSGQYVRRSGKLLAFQLFVVPELLEAGYVPIYNWSAFISPYADVYSANTGSRLTPQLAHLYYYVHVGGKDRLLHRVVAETFIPNPLNLPEVDHIDGDKSNNCVSNLRWVTRSENMKYAYENGSLDGSLRKALEVRLGY